MLCSEGLWDNKDSCGQVHHRSELLQGRACCSLCVYISFLMHCAYFFGGITVDAGAFVLPIMLYSVLEKLPYLKCNGSVTSLITLTK